MAKATSLDDLANTECLYMLDLTRPYMAVYESGKALEELRGSLQELKDFVEILQDMYEQPSLIGKV